MMTESIYAVQRQVAHDIRSPLAALDVCIEATDQMPDEIRSLVKMAINRIRDIAGRLSAADHAPQLEVCDLSEHIVNLMAEKRVEYGSRMGIRIETNIDDSTAPHLAAIDPVEFDRMLSNLINNAVEAIGNKGQVTVSLRAPQCGTRQSPDEPLQPGDRNAPFHSTRDDKIIILTVSDTGKGIPPEILPKLTQCGATFGKENGSGLGLYHARKNVEAWGGRLEIESVLRAGTSVIIQLPTAN